MQQESARLTCSVAACGTRSWAIELKGHDVDVVHEFDHLAMAKMESPFALLAEARSRCPVAHSNAYGGFWVVFTHEDVSSIARDPARFSSAASGITIPHHAFSISMPLIESDPPQHLQFRSPLLERFAPPAIAKLEPDLRDAVRKMIDQFIERGTVDFAQDLTIPIVQTAVTLLLGIPPEEADRVRGFMGRLIADPLDFDAAGDAMEYFGELYDDRSANPRDDIPTLLLTIVVDDQILREEEYLVLMAALVGAGLDSTANAASNMLQLLAQRPELRQQLSERPELIPAAIEEFLRYISPVHSLSRTAMTDVEVRGQHIPVGDRVLLSYVGANHDPAEFDDPEEIRFDRTPNRHVAFGAGPHRCLGAHLARLELRLILEEVLGLLPDYEIMNDRVVRYTGITRGIASLPASFTPRPLLGSPLSGSDVR